MTITKERLAEIKARCDAATEGPWSRQPAIAIHSETRDVVRSVNGLVWTPDLTFIANASQDVPDLVAEVERLRAVIRNSVPCTHCCPHCPFCFMGNGDDGVTVIHADDCPAFTSDGEVK